MRRPSLVSAPKPVFCGSCQNFKSGYSDRAWESCAVAKKHPVFHRDYRGEGTVMVPEQPSDKNAHNDCAEYKAIR